LHSSWGKFLMSNRQPIQTAPTACNSSSPRLAWEAALTVKEIAHPIQRALWLDALGKQLHCHLPPILAQHCQLANVRDNCLVFLVDSPIWHAKLRLASHQLIHAAQKIGLDVNQIHVKTAQIHLPVGNSPDHALPTVSEAARKGVQQVLACLADVSDETHCKQHAGTYPNKPK